jgi:tetratricopeptide (TPR) repeat protein
MNQPNWLDFPLQESILREPSPDRGRIVLWVPADRDASFQYWDRVSNAARAEITIEDGLGSTAASLIRARRRVGSLFGRIWSRLGSAHQKRRFVLPNGMAVDQCGERQNDLLLVWSDANGGMIDEARILSRWPQAKRTQKLGEGLFLVSGLESRDVGPEAARDQTELAADKNTRAHAEAMLAAARKAGARDKQATALTDLGVLALNEGDHQGAIASFENALAIARELGDANRECDVIGNLGMAMLSTRQPERARVLFERALAHARGSGDPFAEKITLERMGIASWSLRDFHGALSWFEQALVLARRFGDRHQEANLLWHQGIQYAELGQREPAIARAEESVALFRALGRPQAASYGAYLQKYRIGAVDDPAVASAMGVTVSRSPQAYLGGSMVASVMAGQSAAEPQSTSPTSGPGLLRMAMSATKAMAGFVGSGFKTAPAELQRKRQRACAGCEHHTGVRCRICGCFTNVKSTLLHEDCPIGKWPS